MSAIGPEMRAYGSESRRIDSLSDGCENPELVGGVDDTDGIPYHH